MFYQRMQVYKNVQFFYKTVRKDGGTSKDEATHLRIFKRSTYEGTDSTDKSLYSSDSVHMVDPSEVWKTPKG